MSLQNQAAATTAATSSSSFSFSPSTLKPSPKSGSVYENIESVPIESDYYNASIYNAILQYDWAGDKEFQTGLDAILQSAGPSTANNDDILSQLTLKAQCFYYSRKFSTPMIDFALFKSYIASQSSTAHLPSNSTDQPSQAPPEPTSPPDPLVTALPSQFQAEHLKGRLPTSFAHIVELITTGQPIPGIREIPNKLNNEKPSESTAERRRKPWEIPPADAGSLLD